MILEMQILKTLGEKRIYVHRDSELIINQIKGEYVVVDIVGTTNMSGDLPIRSSN